MHRNQTYKWILTAAVALFAVLFFAVPTAAQSASSSASGPRLTGNKQIEVSLAGTVQQLTSSAVLGTPPGAHLLIATPEATVDAHLGPYLPKDVTETLKQGEPVQVIGVSQSVAGKTVILVRQLTIAGREVTIRNERGFLVRERPAPHARENRGRESKTQENKSAVNGGAQ